MWTLLIIFRIRVILASTKRLKLNSQTDITPKRFLKASCTLELQKLYY